MQQLPTMLGPAVHYGKDPTHKTLETMCNARAWPQQCWRSCAYGSNIVFRSHASMITEQKKCWELLAQKFDRFQPLRSHSQQHAKTYNNMQQGVKRTQHVTSHNVGSCWPTMLRPLARGFMNLLDATTTCEKDKQARDYKSRRANVNTNCMNDKLLLAKRNRRVLSIGKEHCFHHKRMQVINIPEMCRSTFIISAVTFPSLTNITPKTALLCMNGSPTRYDFRVGTRAFRYRVNKA